MSKRFRTYDGLLLHSQPVLDKESYEREIASQLKMIKDCSDESFLTDVASCFKNDIRVRIAACERVIKSTNLEYLLWTASIEPTFDNCQITIAAAKKCNVHSLVNSALRPVLLTVCSPRFRPIIEDAIPLVTDLHLLEEFIHLSKNCSQKLEMLAYEQAMKLI